MCLFVGKPYGVHTLYLGLCVYDYSYLSAIIECEMAIEKKPKEITPLPFMVTEIQLLGIKFAWMIKLGTSDLGNTGINPNLYRDRIDLWLNNTWTILAGDHTVAI